MNLLSIFNFNNKEAVITAANKGIDHVRAIATTYAKAGAGNIINITSVAARYVQPNFSSYGTAKAALTHMTKLLSQDFAPLVRINAIAPGPILTDALQKVMPEEVKEIMTNNTPLKRLGEVEDIAAAALYLASPASGWVSGKILEIDGGADVSVIPS